MDASREDDSDTETSPAAAAAAVASAVSAGAATDVDTVLAEDFVLVAVGAEDEDSLLELSVDLARLACNQATHPLPGGMLFGLRLPRPAPHTPHIVRAGRAGSQHDTQAAFWLPSRGLHVLTWDARAEAFVPVADTRTPEFTAVRARLAALGTAAVCTAPAPKPGRGRHSRPAVAWDQLAGHITARVLAHCGIPLGVRVAAADDDGDECTAKEQQQQTQVTPFFAGAGAPPRVPRYSPLRPPRGARDGGDSGASSSRNAAALACAQEPARLRWVRAHGCDVLGEFQLAFVHFVVLGCRRSLEHWKALTDVVTGAVLALGAAEHGPPLARAFFAAAAAQFAAVDVRTLDESGAGADDAGAAAFVMETYGPMLAELHDDPGADPALVQAGVQLAQSLARSVGVDLWLSRGEMEVLLARAGDELAPATDAAGLALVAGVEDVQKHKQPRVRVEARAEAPQPSTEHVARVHDIAAALDSADAELEQSALVARRLHVRRTQRRGFHYTGHRGGAVARAGGHTHAPEVRQGPLSFSMDDDASDDDDSSEMAQ